MANKTEKSTTRLRRPSISSVISSLSSRHIAPAEQMLPANCQKSSHLIACLSSGGTAEEPRAPVSPASSSSTFINFLRPRGKSLSSTRSSSPTGGSPVVNMAQPTLPHVARSQLASTSTAVPLLPGSTVAPQSHPFWKSRLNKGLNSPGIGCGNASAWWKPRETIAERDQWSNETSESWDRTRKRVARAARSAFGANTHILPETLTIGMDDLEFAPVIDLQTSAKTLLNIWDALQIVDFNRQSCLRLAERCADTLFSVREEINETSQVVSIELQESIKRLEGVFVDVLLFLRKQNHRPFLKRYLKREEIHRSLMECDESLSNTLGLFSISVQIRLLKSAAVMKDKVNGSFSADSISDCSPTVVHSTCTAQNLSNSYSDADVRTKLYALRVQQNKADVARDAADLREVMSQALLEGSDAVMMSVLQVGRDEIPEAIKALQRALEKESSSQDLVFNQKDTFTTYQSRLSAIADESAERRGSAPALGLLQQSKFTAPRRKTVATLNLATDNRNAVHCTASTMGNESHTIQRDTLDREFMESGIDALRRLSHDGVSTLPNWTITRYEVELDYHIGVGFYSNVYRGTWRGRTVAVKILADTSPRGMYLREAGIWATLRHPNVLALYGASSATGDPPWFFVSPYYANGSLPAYLKKHVGSNIDLLRRIGEIARGMAYLHEKEVLHGDLKGANILVDHGGGFIIADFGQSEMKSEAYRLSGRRPPQGTLRWQPPELMKGGNKLSPAVDVYAFAIVCVEILDFGTLPWQHHDDSAVIRFVLEEDKRPIIPVSRVATPALILLIQSCWNKISEQRPNFQDISAQIKQMQGRIPEDSPRPIPKEFVAINVHQRPSPDMRPVPLPGDNNQTQVLNGAAAPLYDNIEAVASPSISGPDETAHSEESSLRFSVPGNSVHSMTPLSANSSQYSELVLYTPSTNTSTLSIRSIFFRDASPHLMKNWDVNGNHSHGGYDSPLPANERRYRMLLNHEFHPSLVLPLWTPTPVALGSVGYLSKPSGAFITLFNAFDPEKSSNGITEGMASIYGYGRVTCGEQRQDKRNAAQRGLDVLSGLLTFRLYSLNVLRRYSYPLREGHKNALLCTETTKYRYVEELDTSKKWFKENIKTILELYGERHRLQKEDIHLSCAVLTLTAPINLHITVIGTLDAPEYALFVSHRHTSGHAHFNVLSNPKFGQEWGTFTTDNEDPFVRFGPIYQEQIPGDALSAHKISKINGSSIWDTLILARLRFPPDSDQPTSK